MMRIELEGLGRKYRREWIFRGLDYTFEEGQRYALVGPNGSGKSTLMRSLSGHLSPSMGRIYYYEKDKKADYETIYQKIGYAAPYIDMIEELTLREAISFHSTFKPFVNGLTTKDILSILNLKGADDKEIRFFSSGMKQRLKLVLAICSDVSLILLDEPSTNLDQQGVAWYLDLLEKYAADRLCIIASNDAVDIAACGARVSILDYK